MTLRATGFLAIRPEPGLSSTVTLGRELGMTITGQPLFEVRSRPWDCPDPATIDGVLIGSANAIRHGGDSLRQLTHKPVHAVGATTARVAEAAGFRVASSGSGGLQNVLDAISGPARLLRLAGAERIDLESPPGIAIHTAVVYETVPLPFDPAVIDRLGDYPVVLLHSASAATHFAAECDRLSLDRGLFALCALGGRIADAAGAGWRAVHIAPRPADLEMLESLRGACI